MLFRFSTLLVTLLSGFVSSPSAEARPNIILIVADDLGYGDIGCYGSTKNRTPNLDRLAEGGVRFTDFHSNGPMCSPTRAALLTGMYQSRFGRRFESALSGAKREAGLPLEAVTIAEVLRENGYVTGMFGKWHLGYEPPYLPTNQGFDEFRGLVSGDGDFHTRIDRSGNEDWWKNDVIEMEGHGYTTDLITRDSIDFIERHRDTPFFLYVPHLAIHFPWQGPEDPPHREAGTGYHRDKWGIIPDRSNVSPHVKAMIESLDDNVGKILSRLEALALQDNTLVIFTSDNGGYRDYAGGFENISDMGPLRGEKATLYEGGHRVPAIVSWPGKIRPSENEETIMTFDLFETIRRMAEIPPTPASKGDGRDLSAVLLEEMPLPRRTLFWRMGNARAVRKEDWKLVIHQGEQPELYHLERDIGETRNLATENPEIVRSLLDALAVWESSVDASARQFAN